MESDDRARAAVQAFSDWVNGMGHNNQAFVDAVMQEHRTLQQQIFEVMLACIEGWAKTEHYDARNEYAVLKCREIIQLFPGGPRVPFI
jgi:predicted glycosyl hydrolase (DUF1957 family)